MKTLLIVDQFPPHVGGAEVFYAHLVRAMQPGGEVVVVTRKHEDRAASEYVLEVGGPRALFPLFAWRKAWRASKGADRVVGAMFVASPLAWMIGRLRRVPQALIVFNLVGTLFRKEVVRPIAWLLSWAELLLVKLPGQIHICTSEDTKKDLIELGCKRVHIWKGGREQTWEGVRKTEADRRKGRMFSYHGRVSELKGLWTLLDAYASYVQQGGAWHLQLCLGGNIESVEGFLRKHALEKRVTVHKNVPHDQVVKYLESVSIGIVPSRTEGFGLSALEYCALGIPLIAAKVGALPEVVDGKVKWVKPGDVEGLTQALQDIEQGNMQWEEVQNKARSWQESEAQIRELLTSLPRKNTAK